MLKDEIDRFLGDGFVWLDMRAQELADEVTDSVNSGIDPEDFATRIANSHRYLQREVFTQILKPTICEFARQAESGNYDARNESVVKECKKIADSMGWHY